jgi:ribosomal protein S18 acetylase RimI-like enzyme
MKNFSVLKNLHRVQKNPAATSINELKNIERRINESGINTNGSYKQGVQNLIKLLQNPYTTTKNRSSSILRNNYPPRATRLNAPSNLSKRNKLEFYLRNVDPSRIKINVRNYFNENANQNARKFTAKYIINGKNAGNATIIALNQNGTVQFATGGTHPDFRGRGIATVLRALLTKAALRSGYNEIIHLGVNKEHRSKFRPGGNKNTPTSTWIVTKQLGFTNPDGNGASFFRKNNNQTKINNVLRRAGLTI